MQQKITGQEASAAQYLVGLSTPATPCRVPVVLGEFELDTNTYSYVFNGVAYASNQGVAYVAACTDGWWQTAGAATEELEFLGNTNGGYPLWYTLSGGGASASPPVGSASDASQGKVQMPKLDPGHNSGSRGRCTAIILSMWPDSPATTTQGDICLAALSSEQSLDDGVLNSASFSSIAALPQEYVSHLEMPLANWDPSKQAHAFPVPFSEDCLAIQYLPTTGVTTCGHIGVIAITSGCATGQTFRYRVEYKYETTAPYSYLTGLEHVYGSRPDPVSLETLAPHLSNLRPMSVSAMPAKHLPGIAMSAIQKTNQGLFSKLASAATSGGLGKALGGVVSSGIKSIPYVGGLLGGLFDSVFG